MAELTLQSLSEYIFNVYSASSSALSIEDLDRWINEWYSLKYGRVPPMWLVRKRNE